MKTMNGKKVACGMLISDGAHTYEVECVSNGTAYCQRIAACADDRFYEVVEAVEFDGCEMANMWER